MIKDLTENNEKSFELIKKRLISDLSNSSKTFELSFYLNGREEGYSLSDGVKRVCWSEFRNSDQTVIYCGSESDFENNGDYFNLLSENVYNNKNFFSYNQVDEPVKFIKDFFEITKQGMSIK